MSGMAKNLSIVRDTVEDKLEDLLALSSESFLRSIVEARKDYREGRITALADLLDG